MSAFLHSIDAWAWRLLFVGAVILCAALLVELVSGPPA